MKTVAIDQILKTWDRLCDLDEFRSNELSQRFFEQQPALGIYVHVSVEELGEASAQSPLVELALAIWDTMNSAHGQPLTTLTPEAVEAAEEANAGMLAKLAEDSEFQWNESAASLVTSFNQRELLGFCVEVLMQDHVDQPQLAPERVGAELLVLKTIIDCLDQ